MQPLVDLPSVHVQAPQPTDCVVNILSSRLLSKNINIRIYKTIILPVVLYGCETCSLTSREDHSLKMFENRMKLQEVGENYIMRSFITCTLLQV
jgi:hypothetical protein